MSLNAQLKAALENQSLRVFHAVEINFRATSTFVRLIDGTGVVAFPVDGTVRTFDGRDEIFGTLAALSSIREEIATEAPTISVTLLPYSLDAFGEINRPEQQGSMVRIWWGLVDDFTGQVIGSPELIWTGRLDIVNSTIDANAMSCELSVVSAFDRLFLADEGQCLNGTWHKSLWPGQTGLDFNIQATVQIVWGADAPVPSVTPASYYGTNYGSGGGGGGGGIFGNEVQR